MLGLCSISECPISALPELAVGADLQVAATVVLANSSALTTGIPLAAAGSMVFANSSALTTGIPLATAGSFFFPIRNTLQKHKGVFS